MYPNFQNKIHNVEYLCGISFFSYLKKKLECTYLRLYIGGLVSDISLKFIRVDCLEERVGASLWFLLHIAKFSS